MAKQKSTTTLRGSIGNVTLTKGNKARFKNETDRSRLLNDASFQCTRENVAGFAAAGKAGKP